MKSSCKRLLLFAAVAWIGLAGSATAVFAQAPEPVRPGGPIAIIGPRPFQCAPGETAFRVGNGTNDNLIVTGTADPRPNPSAALSAPPRNLALATNIYDQTASDYQFGDTFKLTPPGSGQITKLRVTTRLKANAGDTGNDGISFSTKAAFTPGHLSFGLSPWSTGQVKLFWFDFTAGSALRVNNVSVPTVIVPATFYTDLNANLLRELHVYVQDDTSVDFVQIEGCMKPPAPKYDLLAAKKHDGNAYILHVTNVGQQIMPIGRVEVVELVPAGLTILGFSAPAPWQCPGVTFPMIGPDAFTCSYPIPAGGIAANANLPPIFLKTEGKAECPNCMKVKLYLRAFEGGRIPVKEDDMKNNASCVM